MKHLFFMLIFGIAATGVFAQKIEIRGQVIDKISGKPVESASISATEKAVALTNDSGRFSLTVDKIPCFIEISHVAYGRTLFEITSTPAQPLIIRISPSVVNLNEVQITGERMRNLTKKYQLSVQQFAIDRDRIWCLGFLNNQTSLKRLFLTNLYGDTLASVPARGAEQLFRDPFRNIHILYRDSAFQLFHHDENRIEFLYPTGKSTFMNVMAPIASAFGEKLVYTRESASSHVLTVYYIQKDDPVRYHLAAISDTLEANRIKTWRKIDHLAAVYNIPELANMWTTIYRYNKRGTRFDQVIRGTIPCELFSCQDKLYLINFLKDSLLTYSPDGQFERAIHIDFHKVTSPLGIDYKEINCLCDETSGKVYLLERQMARWKLNQLDQLTGGIGPEILLPDYPGMEGISIHDHAVYFIYQEKTHPYYSRLFRYQL